MLIRLPEAGITPAAADEIRQAVRRFRASGKVVIAHSQGFQPVGTTVSSYMIGASASELWMQNTAAFQLAGFSADGVFLGRAFDKYGVNAQFEQRYEYKNAVNEYTESDFTPAHREAMTAWMTSIYTSALANAAQDRKVTPQALRATIEAGPHSAAQALQRRLIDKIGQVEEAEAEAMRRAGKGSEIMEFGDYADAFSPSEPFGADDRAAFAAQIDRTYEQFIARVARGRNLPPARVREIARGRVWTGAQAKGLGLVDQLGGLEEAIAKARQLAEIPNDESVRFKRYPESQSPFAALSELFGVSGEAARVLIGIGGIMNDPQAEAAVRQLQAERARASGATVLADQPY